MNICLIGNGLTNLILAKILVKKKIKIDLYYKKKTKNNQSSRTIGISNENLIFLREKILGNKKFGWAITKIDIFNEKYKQEKILDFDNLNPQKFSIIKNNELFNFVKNSLKNQKYFKLKKINQDFLLEKITQNNSYDLIINSDPENYISKKYFYKKIVKDYNSTAYVTIINHKNCNNRTASQIFTNFGPLAFLPISENKTSVVFSVLNNKNIKDKKKILEIIKKYNIKYKINSFNTFEKFNLKFFLSRKYFYKNILNFGDGLHKVHPLAGQGFNMNLRDINIFSKIIDERLDLGLPLDSSILEIFEKKVKHLNFIFANGIDFIHEFFIFDNKFKNQYTKKVFKILRTNKTFNKYINEIADKGLRI